jgi:hypothetical protein
MRAKCRSHKCVAASVGKPYALMSSLEWRKNQKQKQRQNKDETLSKAKKKEIESRYWSNLQLLYGKSVPSRFHAFGHARNQFNHLCKVLRPSGMHVRHDEDDDDDDNNENNNVIVHHRSCGEDLTVVGVLGVWSFFQRYHTALKKSGCIDLSFPRRDFLFSDVCEESVLAVVKAEYPDMGAVVYFPHEDAFVDFSLSFQNTQRIVSHNSAEKCQSIRRAYTDAVQKGSVRGMDTIEKTETDKKPRKVYKVITHLAKAWEKYGAHLNLNLLRLAALRSFYKCVVDFMTMLNETQQTAETLCQIASLKVTQLPDVERFEKDLYREITLL